MVIDAGDGEPEPARRRPLSSRRGSLVVIVAVVCATAALAGGVLVVRELDSDLADLRANDRRIQDALERLVAQERVVVAREPHLVFANACSRELSVVLFDESGADVWRGKLSRGLTDTSVETAASRADWGLQVARDDGWIRFDLDGWVSEDVAVIPAIACPREPP